MNIAHLENGMVFGNDVKPGLTQAFMCNQGYEIKGDYVVTCQADGTWSPDIPTCIEKRKVADTPSVDEESTSSSSKSADVIASSSFTPPTATKTLETTAATTTTTAPTTTFLTTTKPTSQASTVGTTTVSSTTSTEAVTTQTQSTYDVVTSGGVSSETITSEVPCDDNERVLSTDSCKQSFTSCPFPEVYDPGTDECVTYCPSSLGTTYQVHQDQSIDIERYSLIGTINTYNYSVCLDECLTERKCAAIVIRSAVIKGASGYACSFCKYHLAPSNAVPMEGDMVYLRNCGSNHEPTEKFESPLECSLGEMYSYSKGTCAINCIQEGKNTFQNLTDLGINDSVDGIDLVLVRVEQKVNIAQCLIICSEDPRCALLQVRQSGELYDCDVFGPALRYLPLLVNYGGRHVFLRDCE